MNWTIILISQSLSTELKVYQEIKENMTISVKQTVVKNITVIEYRNVNKYEIQRKLITHWEMDFNAG